jgi:alkylation response protein AidB-like acyl-CoA dehydrogenase
MSRSTERAAERVPDEDPDGDRAGPLLPQDPDVEGHPVVARVRRLAAQVLAPSASDVDTSAVPRSHLDALGAAGVLGLAAPASAGGLDAPAAVVRRVNELLAGADLSTWFVQAQHHAPVRAVAAAGRHPELLAELAAGRAVAGIAFSHLRRRPARVLAATPDGDGWRLDGTAPWYTGWGLNDVALVGALTDDDRAVFSLVRPVAGPALRPGERVRTAALDAASTVPLTFDGYRVGPADLVRVEPAGQWAATDALATVNAPPAAFGLAESALTLLHEHGRRRHEARAVDAACRLAEALGGVRGKAYHLMDHAPPGEATEERLALRARALRLAVDSGTALVTAGAGGAMSLASPAQRKAREALFLLVQAQTADVRAATLATFT